MFDLSQEKNFEKQLKELELQHEALKRGRKELQEKLQLTEEQIAHNLKDENIPQEYRAHVQEQRKKLEALLEQTHFATNAKESKKTHKERSQINNTWLFVR